MAIVAFFSVISFRRGGPAIGPALVLQKLKVNEKAADGFIIDIDGRASGVIAWLLTVVGFDAVSSLRVTSTEITFKSSSLFGEIHNVVPLTRIAHTRCGYSKPIGFFVFGVLCILIGLFSVSDNQGNPFSGSDYHGIIVMLIFLLIGAGLLTCYWLFKRMFIVIETSGGTVMGLSFKSSIIENVSVDIKKAIEAIRLINKKILESQGLEPATTETPENKPSGVCSECGHQNTPGNSFCEQCGTKLGN